MALLWLSCEILMLVYTFALTVFFIAIWHGVSDFYLTIRVFYTLRGAAELTLIAHTKRDRVVPGLF